MLNQQKTGLNSSTFPWFRAISWIILSACVKQRLQKTDKETQFFLNNVKNGRRSPLKEMAHFEKIRCGRVDHLEDHPRWQKLGSPPFISSLGHFEGKQPDPQGTYMDLYQPWPLTTY